MLLLRASPSKFPIHTALSSSLFSVCYFQNPVIRQRYHKEQIILLKIITKSKLETNSQRYWCHFLKYLKSHSSLSLREKSLSYYYMLEKLFDFQNKVTDQFNKKANNGLKKEELYQNKPLLLVSSLSTFMSKPKLLRVFELQAVGLLLLSMHMFWECVPTDIQQMVSGWTSGSLIRLWSTNLW